MNPDVVTFCQNDLPYTSFSTLNEMKKKGELCDITIITSRNGSIAAHRAILASSIPYFRSALANGEVDTEKKEISLLLLDPGSVESLVDFAYSGKVSISSENVFSLVASSQFLQLHQIRDACVEFLTKRIDIQNAVQLRALANCLNNSKLEKCSSRFIQKNFEEILKSDDFLSLTHPCFKEIISHDDLNVSSEEVVFEAVVKWVNVSPSERHALLKDLLSEVRMIYLPNDYLIKRVARDELVQTSKACVDLIDEVKNFHLLPRNKSVFSNLKLLPRRYSSIIKNDIIYAISECTTYGISVYCYDDSGNWCNLSRTAQNDGIYRVVAVNEKIYIFHAETIRTLHVRTLEWDILDVKHEWIFGAAVLFHGNLIYCFGSYHDDMINKVRCFDTECNKWQKKGIMTIGRYSSAAVSLEECIYVTGGCNGKDYFNTVAMYNPSKDQWNEMASMFTPRACHSCTTIRGKIFVCGGDTTSGSTSPTAEMYHPMINQWIYISPLKFARRNFSLLSYNGDIYALGGTMIAAGSVFLFHDTEVYDLNNDRWKTGFHLPEKFKHAVLISSTTN